MVEIVKRGICS